MAARWPASKQRNISAAKYAAVSGTGWEGTADALQSVAHMDWPNTAPALESVTANGWPDAQLANQSVLESLSRSDWTEAALAHQAASLSDGLHWVEAALAQHPVLLSMAGHSHEAHEAAYGVAQQLDSLVSAQLTGASASARSLLLHLDEFHEFLCKESSPELSVFTGYENLLRRCHSAAATASGLCSTHKFNSCRTSYTIMNYDQANPTADSMAESFAAVLIRFLLKHMIGSVNRLTRLVKQSSINLARRPVSGQLSGGVRRWSADQPLALHPQRAAAHDRLHRRLHRHSPGRRRGRRWHIRQRSSSAARAAAVWSVLLDPARDPDCPSGDPTLTLALILI